LRSEQLLMRARLISLPRGQKYFSICSSSTIHAGRREEKEESSKGCKSMGGISVD